MHITARRHVSIVFLAALLALRGADAEAQVLPSEPMTFGTSWLTLGADVPACLLSMTARGSGAGDELALLDDPRIAGTPVLLVNPRVPLSTAEVFAGWGGEDRGPLGDWRGGRNDLEAPAIALVLDSPYFALR